MTGNGVDPWLPGAPRDTIAISDLGDDTLRVVEPFPVEISQDAGWIIVWDPALEELGYGDTLDEAITDFRRAIRALYRDLASRQDRLSGEMAQIWAVLQKRIQAR